MSIGDTKCIETVSAYGARGISDIYLPGLRILHYNRASTDDAVFGHRVIIRDTAVNAQKAAAAHFAPSSERNAGGEIAVIPNHGMVPNMSSACDYYIVTNADLMMQNIKLSDKYVLANCYIIPDER
jgi:hypothetical protein